MEQDIPSPYNFVPVSDQVFCPKWAKQISHDIPFSDGISGSIDIKLKTITPTYIRNTGENENAFFQLSGDKALIPGSSLKGMLRNIVEIASFGQMKQVNDHRYSYREIKPWFVKKFKNVQSGWLRQVGSRWFVTPCKWVEVKQKDLENFYLKEYGEEIYLGEEEDGGFKYDRWEYELEVKFDVRFDRGRTKAVNLGRGKSKGIIVFTGQPTSRSQRNSKKIQFIFYGDQQEIEVTHLKEDFLFIHTPKQGEENDWQDYWKPIIEEGDDVPVFFTKENNTVTSMGLTRLYRLPYDKSIHNAIPRKHFSREIDLASGIFGWIENETALKGRVHVGHLLADSFKESQHITTVLGGPKASYTPNYVMQNEKEGKLTGKNYKDYNDPNVRIRGWKRYSTKWQALSNLPEPPNEKVKTEFTPIKSHTTFVGKLRVHNLKPEELGALLWALTWGGDDTLIHNIGMGKPYGFGNVKIEIENSNLTNIAGEKFDSFDSLIDVFESMMAQQITNWKESSQILHLKALANPQFKYTYNNKRYPSMGMETEKKGVNEFVKYKDSNNSRVLRKLY